jgi:hypothetical protein
MRRWLLIVLIAVALVPLSAQVSQSGATYTQAPDRIRSSWGRRLNPTGLIPDRGFRAIYFNRDNPGDVVFQEDVDSIAIKYAWSEFHQIESQKFAAYWVGRLSFESETTRQFSVSQSWARSRIIIDGEIVFDENSRGETFTHVFTPGEHVIEVEYINNWHTVEFKVTIGDVIHPLSEPELTAYLEARNPRPANLYYVGLYESGRRDTSVDVTLPPGRAPAILWLTSYEAIDWNISSLPPGSTVIISSYSPGSRARGPGVGRVVHVARTWSIHSETRRCSCSPGGYHCEDNQDLEDVAQRLRAVTGLRLSGYAMAYSAPAVIVQRYGGGVARHILEQREAMEAARRQCTRNNNPDFDTMMGQPR